jgi:hypothetical protein
MFGTGDYRNKDQNPEKLSWVRIPVKMVSVARILGTPRPKLFVSETVQGSSLGKAFWFRDNFL